ncbi:hypothetical protein BDR04DRAFT_1146917 [Suillus decipiens]|nr:hypothetical protein BDR04DRAFT_1146917 [Suillus decipiens]
MHTQNNGGIDIDLAIDLDTNFTWTPPLLEGYEILVGKVYDLVELEQVDKGIMPAAFKGNVQQVGFDLKDNISDVQSVVTGVAPKPSAKTNPNPTEIPISTSIVELPDEDEEVFYDAIR